MLLSEMNAKPPKILLYGDLGTGKTALSLTLGHGTLVLDFDDGLMTGRTLKDKFASERQKVEVKQFLEENPHKTAVAFSKGKTFVIGLANDLAAKRVSYRALIVDSLSSLAEAAVAQVMSNSGRVGGTPEIQHWGIAFSEIKQFIGVLRSLPIPVVLIAHEQVKSIGSGVNKEDKLEIAVSGKNLASQIARYFDEIWYMRARPVGAGKTQYVIQTVVDGKIPCRSRACLPNYTDTEVGMWELIKLCGYVPPAEVTK